MADRALEAWISDQLYALVGESLVLSAKEGEKHRKTRRRRGRFDDTMFDDFFLSLTSTSLSLPKTKTGYAESAVVAFIVSLARRAHGTDALAAQLEALAETHASRILLWVP